MKIQTHPTPTSPAAPLCVVRGPCSALNDTLPVVRLQVDRLRLAKRRWRGVAEDGMEFGFELERPLQPGDFFHETSSARYVIEQDPESVLEISLALAPSAAAAIGWAIGNLHLELSAEPTRLLTPDDPAARQLLNRIGVPFSATQAVFRPGRFARGPATDAPATAQDLGPSHRHAP